MAIPPVIRTLHGRHHGVGWMSRSWVRMSGALAPPRTRLTHGALTYMYGVYPAFIPNRADPSSVAGPRAVGVLQRRSRVIQP